MTSRLGVPGSAHLRLGFRVEGFEASKLGGME